VNRLAESSAHRQMQFADAVTHFREAVAAAG
jgi:hypothetical protein